MEQARGMFARSLVPVAWVCLATISLAQEKQSDAPRIIAIAPLEVSPGTTATLRLRGVKLSNATEIRITGTDLPLEPQIKEKKKADVPNGLEAKDVGDTQVEVSVVLPAELALGKLKISVSTTEGVTSARDLCVVAASELIEEKEPNGGFREAQSIECGKTIRGSIKEDKDVDVFAFSGHAGQKYVAEIAAGRLASLLDGVLTLFDAHGRQLAMKDDCLGRDPVLAFEISADGQYFVVVTDANDRGGAWHGYELTLKETR